MTDDIRTSIEGLHAGPRQLYLLRGANGEIRHFNDLQPAQLSGEVIDTMLTDTAGKQERLYINKPALAGVLLSSQLTKARAELYSAFDSTLFLNARVGNIHVPFYYECGNAEAPAVWKPLFGTVRGAKVESDRDASQLHPELARVQEVLNANLIIPRSALRAVLDPTLPEGFQTPQKAPIAEYIGYQNVTDTPWEGDDAKFVERLSAYNPTFDPSDNHAKEKWIKEVIAHI